jgi:hypothetical protein
MSLDMLQSWLGWCALINIAVLTIWWLMIVFAHDWIYRFHTRWFELPRERFDAIHYAGLAAYKIAIYLFLFVPWLGLLIVR